MKTIVCLMATCATAFNAFADTHYVDINNVSPVAPYTNWSMAANNIQDAVDAAVSNDMVLVTNGFYLLSATIVVEKNITVKSSNGYEETIIDGGGAVSCMQLGAYGSDECIVSGFTLQNGYSDYHGGGVNCYKEKPVVTNCLIQNNLAEYNGGGMYDGTLLNSIVRNNISHYFGGGLGGTVAKNCLIEGNTARHGSGGIGGGSGWGSSPASALNCTIIGNSAQRVGGSSVPTTNSIVWYNSSLSGISNIGAAVNSCSPEVVHGENGSITNEPVLVSAMQLSAYSPCIGAGTNVAAGVDITGGAWLSPPSMGCAEFNGSGSLTGAVAMALFGPATVEVGTTARYLSLFDGHAEQTVISFGDGNPLINSVELLERTWGAAGSYEVVLSSYNETYPAGIHATQTIDVVQSAPIHVSTTGNNSNDGLGWASAKQTIQAGIDAQSVSGGKVLVGSGTYSLSAEIVSDRAVQLVGDGAASTILDGGGTTRCLVLGNHHSLVEGLTIQNGFLAGVSGSSPYVVGSGIFCNSLDPVVSGCTIRANTSNYIYSDGAIIGGTINNCLIKENRMGGSGGAHRSRLVDCTINDNEAFYSHGGGAGFSSLRGGSIAGNYAGGWGGGLYQSDAAGCLINNNTASKYGGGIAAGSAVNCDINNNAATQYGAGGVYKSAITNCNVIANQATTGGGVYDSTAVRCEIRDNTASSYGGGLYGTYQQISYYNESRTYFCVVSNNTAGGKGGGICRGYVSDSLIVANAATDDGGGVWDTEGLDRCTIVANSSGDQGGGVYQQNDSAQVPDNSIIWYNSAATAGDDIFRQYGYSPMGRTSCCPDFDPVNTDGNITNSPVFADLSAGNYRLSNMSPCVNGGNNDYANPSAEDLDGNQRIHDFVADMGAYEYQDVVDSDNDIMSDGYEIFYFGGRNSADPTGDTDGDGYTELEEYIAGVNPLDSFSVFQYNPPNIYYFPYYGFRGLSTMGAEALDTNAFGYVVSWSSVPGRLYDIYWKTNLQDSFELLEGNIPYPQNSYTAMVQSAESAGFFSLDVKLEE